MKIYLINHSTGKIVAPINIGKHWCLIVADVFKKTFQFLDPFGESLTCCKLYLKKIITFMKKYNNLSNKPIDTENWQVIIENHPKQTDSYNCGVIICIFACCILQGKVLPLHINNIDEYHDHIRIQL